MSPVPTSTVSARSLFKNILEGSGVYAIAQLLPTLTSLILVPITTRFLSPADYGIQDLLAQVSMVVSLLLGGYFASALGFFYFEAEPSHRHRVAGTGVIGSLSLGTIAALVCLPFASAISALVFPGVAAAPYIQVTFLLMPPSFVLDALMGWLRIVNRPVLFVAAAAVRAVLTVVCTIWFVGILKLHIWGVLYSTTVSLVLTAAALGIYWVVVSGPAFELATFIRMARYALPLGLSGIAMFILHFGDSFILPHYRPYDDLGIYRLAYKVAMMVSAVYGAFGNYWNAQVFAIMRRDDADTVFSRLLTYVVLGTAFVSLGLIVSSRPALRKLAGPDFQSAITLVPVLVVAYAVRSLSEFMRPLFLSAGRPGYDACATWTAAAVCLGGYGFLIPRYGVWGAAFATLGAFLVLAAISMTLSYRLRPYRFEGVRLAKISVATAISVLAWLLLPSYSFWALIFSAIASLIVFVATLWLSGFPTPGERHILLSAPERVLRLVRAS